MQTLNPILLAVLVAGLVMQTIFVLFKRIKRHETFMRMQIPGPKPNLIHGHLYETRRQPYVRFAHTMHEKYGENVGMFLGGDPFLMTKDLELIQQVFVAKSRIFYDRMNFYLNVDPVPDNLICQRGDRWRYMRKLLTPAFSTSRMRSSQFYRDSQQTVCKFMHQLEANSQQVAGDKDSRESIVEDTYDRMAAVALDVIVKTAFHMDNVISFAGSTSGKQAGKTVCSKDADTRDPFLFTVKRACRLAFNPLVELIFCLPFLDGPLTFLCGKLYFGSIIQLLFDRLDYLVRRSHYPNKWPETDSGSAVGKTSDEKLEATTTAARRRIIDNLVEVLRERKITRSEFTGNAFVIVFAGFETTANALTFTLWLLAKHIKVQDKLRQELRSQLDKLSQTDRANNKHSKKLLLLNDEQLALLATGCSYLEMVINESLRLYPPVPGLSCRQASTDCSLSSGMRIEKGVNIIPSVFSIHRDKSIWGSDATEFRPERFEMLDVSQLNSAMFMPFGLGPRNCIGKALAMHEMKIVLGRLLIDYRVEVLPNRTPSKLKLCSPINITLTCADKIPLRFIKKSI